MVVSSGDNLCIKWFGGDQSYIFAVRQKSISSEMLFFAWNVGSGAARQAESSFGLYPSGLSKDSRALVVISPTNMRYVAVVVAYVVGAQLGVDSVVPFAVLIR